MNFTPGETVLLIGLIAHAIAVFFAFWITRKQVQNEAVKIVQDVQAGIEKLEQVRQKTNSMRTKLEAGKD